MSIKCADKDKDDLDVDLWLTFSPVPLVHVRAGVMR